VRPRIELPSDGRSSTDVRQNFATRWRVTEAFFDVVASSTGLPTKDVSLLDVGGIGTYARSAPRYTCINVDDSASTFHLPCTIYGRSDPLPYRNDSYDLVLAESALHHAASHAPALFGEMARVSASHVMIVEDLLEAPTSSGPSADVVLAYRRHDTGAVYRSLGAWADIAARYGLVLSKVSFLHRVPLHGKYWASTCELGFAPMAYLLWTKPQREQQQRRIEPDRSVASFLRDQRAQERAAGLRCDCTRLRCVHCSGRPTNGVTDSGADKRPRASGGGGWVW